MGHIVNACQSLSDEIKVLFSSKWNLLSRYNILYMYFFLQIRKIIQF